MSEEFRVQLREMAAWAIAVHALSIQPKGLQQHFGAELDTHRAHLTSHRQWIMTHVDEPGYAEGTALLDAVNAVLRAELADEPKAIKALLAAKSRVDRFLAASPP